MSEEIIELKIDADVSGAKSDVKELNQELKKTNEEVQKLNTSNKAAVEQNKKFATSVLDIVQNYTSLGSSMRRVRGIVGKLTPLFKGFFKTVKLGIASTGIGALVIILGSVLTAMMSTEKGAKGFKAILNGIGEVVKVLIKPLQIVGDAVLSLFGVDDTPVIDSAEQLKNELSQIDGVLDSINAKRKKDEVQLFKNKKIVGDTTKSEQERLAAAEDSFNKTKQSDADTLIALQEKEKLLHQSRADMYSWFQWEKQKDGATQESMEAWKVAKQEHVKILEQIQDLQNKTAIDEINYSDEISFIKSHNVNEEKEDQQDLANQQKKWREERIAGEKKVNDIISKLEEELAIKLLKTEEEKELKKLEFQNKKSKESIENSKADQKTKDAALLLLDDKYKQEQAAIVKKYDDQDEEEREAEAEQLEKIRNENLIALEKDENEQAKMKLKIQKDAEIEALEGLENRKELELEINKKYKRLEGDVDKKAKKEQDDRDQALHEQKIALAMSGLSLIEGIAGEGTKLAKASAIAQATITGTQSVINAYNSGVANVPMMAATGGAYGFIQGGIAAGFSALQIKKIAAGQGPDPGSVSGSNVDTTPAPTMMGGSFTLGEGPAPEPLKAFVVTDEMTNSQNQLANIRRRATI